MVGRPVLAPEAFSQFYGFAEEDVVRELGPGDVWRKVPVADLDNFVAGLNRLFKGDESAPTSALTNGTTSIAASASTGIDGEPG